ncbi:hypothetical protein [Streptococcus marmotae]|uniref:hypothetical protein n=1 Tax=Streptococcus marmotae TaxID=1825069 RepID=UPI000A5692A7|nr:hypothetical protein [Streptococcus marmotae]
MKKYLKFVLTIGVSLLTVTAVNAYGSYTGFFWKISTSSSMYGNAARSSFEGAFDIEIHPVSMRIESFGYTGTVYCDGNGIVTASWN